MDTISWICNFLKSTELSQFIWRYYINQFETAYIMPSSHKHKAVEIIFVIDGCGFIKFENDVVKIIKNNTLIIPSEKTHQFFGEKNCSCTLINIHIDFSAVTQDELSVDKNDINLFMDLFLKDQSYLKLTDYDTIESVMKRIVFEMNTKPSNYEILVKLYFSELFLILSRLAQEHKLQQEKAAKNYVIDAIKFIDDSLNQELTSEIISGAVHISPDYLHHIFKDATGVSMMEFVTIKRIQSSKLLLTSTRKKVTEIAYLVGISSSQYFATLFKKHTEMTPNQYRKISRLTNNRNPNIFT